MKKNKEILADPNVKIKFRKLADVFRDKISKGEYPVGSILPCEREMQAIFDVSRITVRNAVELLTNEGLIEKRQGRGGGAVVVSSTPNDEKMRRGHSFGTFFSIHSYGYRNDILEVMEGIIRELNVWESNLHPFPFVPDIDQAEYVKSVVERKLVDGIFLWPMGDYTKQVVEFLKEKEFPFLFITPSSDIEHAGEAELLNSLKIPVVAIAEHAPASNLVDRAIAKGCEKIIIAGFKGEDVNKTHAFFSEVMKEKKCALEKFEAPDHRPFESAQSLLKSNSWRTDKAMLMLADNQFLPYFDAAVEHLGISMPDDASVIRYQHNRHTEEIIYQRHTTFDRPFKELGVKATRMMNRLLENKLAMKTCLTGELEIIPAQIIDRGTAAV